MRACALEGVVPRERRPRPVRCSLERAERKRRVTAQAAIGQIVVDDLFESMRTTAEYAAPYRDRLRRSELRSHLTAMIVGLTIDLERKSVGPIAVMHDLPRYTLHFMGGGHWEWEPLMDLLRQEVSREIGVANGSLVLDGSANPKKGEATVGVARQWCGRLGKQDNCVIGVYAAYVGKDDAAVLVASELFLPREWADDWKRRREVEVPTVVAYRSQPRIAREMLARLASKLPFQWVLGGDEFGRRAFRDEARALSRSYLVDVPRSTKVRRVRKGTDGTLERKQWAVGELRRRIPVVDWAYFHVRDGEKGFIEVRATMLQVATEREGQPWARETLVLIETLDGLDRWYCLGHAPDGAPLAEFVRQAGPRHRTEETFEEAKGEVGLDHFETRTWQGWHHHMTLC